MEVVQSSDLSGRMSRVQILAIGRRFLLVEDDLSTSTSTNRCVLGRIGSFLQPVSRQEQA